MKTGVKKDFIKNFAETPQAAKRFSAEQIEKMQKYGRLPTDWVVHHKLPLFRGGTNQFSNLRVLKRKTHEILNKRLHWYEKGENPYGLD